MVVVADTPRNSCLTGSVSHEKAAKYNHFALFPYIDPRVVSRPLKKRSICRPAGQLSALTHQPEGE